MTTTSDITETPPPPPACTRRPSVIGELGRLAQEAFTRVEEGFVLEALSSLVALARVNTMVIENLQERLADMDIQPAVDPEFHGGVYL